MIKKGDKVALALSGGKDSITLLAMLVALKKKVPFELIAITIDLGIGCDYNRTTMQLAASECKRLGVPHHMFKLKDDLGYTLDELVEKTATRNSCSYCGVARRYYLNIHARELGADKLAIGHTLNDTAETVMMNVLRNEPQRLFRYNEHLVNDSRFIPRIKPFLRLPEAEVVAYGKLKQLPLLDKKCCPYSIFAFRKFVRQQLEDMEERYPGTRFKVLNSFLSMQKMFKELPETKQLQLSYCKTCKEPSSTEHCKLCQLKQKLRG